MEDIDMKKVIIFLILVLVIITGAIFGIIKLVSGDEEYTLEVINEEDYKYFSVYTDEKYGVIDTMR